MSASSNKANTVRGYCYYCGAKTMDVSDEGLAVCKDHKDSHKRVSRRSGGAGIG